MADYWKSNDRKYCDFCKCWISDNKASVAFHESGKRHKLNVSKRITEISRNSEKSERERLKMDADIRKMEDAAMHAYARDIHARGDFTARSIGTVMQGSSSQSSSTSERLQTIGNRPRQVDPMRLPGSSDDEEDDRRVTVSKVGPDTVAEASLWVEGKSDEGYTYYWNVKTNESVWEEPKEGFLSLAEYERINDLATKQQEIQYAEDAQKFRDNANEEVARYNRERLKTYRKPDNVQEKEEKRIEKERRDAYKTEEDTKCKEIGTWQVVETKPLPPSIDWELPKSENQYVAPVVTVTPDVPSMKRFKEKTINIAIDDGVSTFKKRKFASKGNARQRLADD